ncbi:LemA family protein [Pseudanabaena sp. ABRG5-3]|uniref:LemA family protein n=1 Tax=Pseudanabaena sp. ABRG5-3 TaxID=685565 RepID=UPI000DC7433C|nr:LemA family protein [Pseudanabaena sp. ABRG5-3]BBC26273.1 LemA family protein [Pseudanabaena sp. ABRG5-3]
MSKSEVRVPEKIAPEVFALASRYYADYRQGYSESDLIKAGSEADIPPEFIHKAIQEIQAQNLQKLEKEQRVRTQWNLLLKLGIGVLSIIILWIIWTYNSFTSSSVRVEVAWAQVENQLQRRADLLPNLVRLTQSYVNHERSLVTSLIQARESYLKAATFNEKAVAIAKVNLAIEQFNDYANIHPELKSSHLFINLQYEIAGTENRLAVERMRYNQAVADYNQIIQTFPNSLLSKSLNFQNKPFFKAVNSSFSPI